ncbi:MAG: GxxExxY protein [Planctomycetota bacterium]
MTTVECVDEKDHRFQIEVSNMLASGFLEKVYENAVAIAIRKVALDCKQ